MYRVKIEYAGWYERVSMYRVRIEYAGWYVGSKQWVPGKLFWVITGPNITRTECVRLVKNKVGERPVQIKRYEVWKDREIIRTLDIEDD